MASLDCPLLPPVNHRHGPRPGLVIHQVRVRDICERRPKVWTARPVSDYVGFQMNRYLTDSQDRVQVALSAVFLVVNSELLVCTVVEMVWCFHGTLIANTLLGFQTAKALYFASLLFWIFHPVSGSDFDEMGFQLIAGSSFFW